MTIQEVRYRGFLLQPEAPFLEVNRLLQGDNGSGFWNLPEGMILPHTSRDDLEVLVGSWDNLTRAQQKLAIPCAGQFYVYDLSFGDGALMNVEASQERLRTLATKACNKRDYGKARDLSEQMLRLYETRYTCAPVDNRDLLFAMVDLDRAFAWRMYTAVQCGEDLGLLYERANQFYNDCFYVDGEDNADWIDWNEIITAMDNLTELLA